MSHARAVLAVSLCLAACGSSHDLDGGDGGGFDMVFVTDLGSHDGGVDAPIGDGLVDFGIDARVDLGPPMCVTGVPCDPVVGCNGGRQCQAEIDTATTYDVPDGGVAMIPVAIFPGGYCTNAPFGTPLSIIGAAGACSPTMASDDPTMAGRDGCDACSKCVKLQDTTATMPGVAMCLERCTPNATDNDVCRDGYSCDPASHTCVPGQCTVDTQCRLYRVDSNGNGMLDPADHTVLDPTSTATCDTATYRCSGGGTPGAHAGDPCTTTSMCEAGGLCLGELDSHLPGGYCTRLYCDLPGVTCGTGEVCRDLGSGLHLCMLACTVGAEDASLVYGTGGHGDTCRAGYACYYDEHSGVGSAGNGACTPGTYNAITTPNVGARCTMDSECWSPHGLGKCVTDTMQDVCTVIGCDGFADPEGTCGAGNHCETVMGMGFSLCLHLCTTPDDCGAAIGGGANMACVALTSGGPTECFPGCQADSQCQTGHTCVGASLTSLGQCM